MTYYDATVDITHRDPETPHRETIEVRVRVSDIHADSFAEADQRAKDVAHDLIVSNGRRLFDLRYSTIEVSTSYGR